MVAEMWCETLRNEGVPAFAKPSGTGSPRAEGASVSGWWVMVPDTDLRRATQVLEFAIEKKKRHRRKFVRRGRE
jgi:hypothetical protein